MKHRNYSLYFLAGGLLLVTIQLLIYIFGYVNGESLYQQDIIVVVQEKDLGDVISEIWAGILGTVLLMVLFVRRLSKGPEAMMVLVGALLWVIQILGMYSSDVSLGTFFFTHIVGIFGTLGVAVSGFYDAYLIKSTETRDDIHEEE